MKNIAVLLGLAFYVLGGSGCDLFRTYRAKAEVPFSASADAAGLEKLALETRNGRVEVTCVEGLAAVQIEATKFARGTTEEDALEHAEQIEIEVVRAPEEPGLLRIVTKIPYDDRGRSPGAHFNISAPPNVAFHLRTSNGHVGVTGGRRDVDIQTSNGRVTVADVQGALYARTSNGAVAVKDLTGDADVKTSNGPIDLQSVRGNAVRAVTSNGRIKAAGTSGNATLKTSNGAIDLLAASLPDTPTVSAETSNGAVLVEVPPTVSARLRMRTSNGRAAAELGEAAVTHFDSGKSHVSATINAGAGKIDISSSNGPVTFRVK